LDNLRPNLSSAQAVTAELRKAIVTGQWPDGTRLPSTRELARQYEISKKTVGQALRQLEKENLIVCRPRRCAIVGTSAPRSRRVTMLITPRDKFLGETRENWLAHILAAADAELLSQGFESSRAQLDCPDAARDPVIVRKIDHMVDQGLGGAFLMGSKDESEVIASLFDEREIPWISLKPISRGAAFNFVTCNNYDGRRAVGEMFARTGRSRVLYMAGVDSQESMDAFAGFQLGYIQAGGTFEGIFHHSTSASDEACGYDGFMSFYQRNGAPEAVLCSGDFVALGVIRACRELGLTVPGDVAVVGGSGYEMSAFSEPSLSVIRQPMDLLGQEIARLLTTCIRENKQRVMGMHVNSQVILRNSFSVDPMIVEQVNKNVLGATVYTGSSMPQVPADF